MSRPFRNQLSTALDILWMERTGCTDLSGWCWCCAPACFSAISSETLTCQSGLKLYLKVYNSLLRSWDRDPSTSTIQRVKLSELDFPAITVCPDYATDSLATRMVFNMIEFDDKVRKNNTNSRSTEDCKSH